MYDGMPTNESGGFNMTTISIGNSFGGGKANNNYQSDVFDKFVSSIPVLREEVCIWFREKLDSVTSA